ncbi:hypothetical protein [Streptomyces decoyicus]|uniref:hypothetical protein n=1 Tax=Streptomyces decoyicus TaxID=249567 RepID=UPI00069F6DCF|nr:hypothetical protein [Streptomyces decoyicus]KOG50561.1 hypothetical protein ADK74_00480 [Streptomyces decoyicus]QZY15145.1 hypothetical protein K7C20_07685 [Streptomyces decoyicus]
MRKERFSDVDGGSRTGSPLRRVLIGAILLAILTAIAGLLAFLTRQESTAAAKGSASAAPSPASPSPQAPSDGGESVAPPSTSDPITFAKAATKALWTYDTRSSSQEKHLADLKRWMTDEKKYADWKSITGQVPSAVLWARMRDNHQHASATVGEGHFPQAFKSALAADPGAITDAYIYAVTVTGKQSIAWKGSGAGAEARSTTLAVQCRPHQHCALAGVLPSVAP